jgi:hypothetical protein
LKSGGVVGDAAALLGYHPETLRAHVRNSPDMQSYIETVCRPAIDDLAEGVIVKDIKAGSVGTAKWWSERANRARFSTVREPATSHLGAGRAPLLRRVATCFIGRHGET